MGSSGLPLSGVELIAKGLSSFTTDLSKGNTAVAQFGQKTESVGAQTNTASQVIIGALRQVGTMAVDALFKAGRALIGFGQDSLKLAGDFQQGMQQFQVAAGQDLDTAGLQQFHDLFLQLGKDLPVSTSEVQQAAIEMVKGGIDPAILAAGALKQNIQFAAAAMDGDLVGAAEISSKIVAGWAQVGATAAEKAELLTKATDLLTKAANASSVNVQELSLGLFNVQATAKNAGIPLEDVTTVLAELAGDFSSASVAGNSMASFITRLQPTTKAATEAMEALGLVTKDGNNVFYDAQGKFIGLRAASGILKDAFKDLTDEQRTSVMQTIFQKDAMGVAAGLAQRGVEGYDAMASSLTNAMGVTQAGATVQAGYNTALENAMGSIEALKITIGEAFLPVLTDLLNTFVGPGVSAITTFAAAFAKLLPSIVASSDPFQAFLDAIKTVAPSTTDFVNSLESWKDTLVELVSPLSTLNVTLADILPTIEGVAAGLATFVILSQVAGWVATAASAIAALSAAFAGAGGGIAGIVALLGGPVTLTIGAVALAVGALVVAWQNNWGDIQGKTAAVWAVIQPVFEQFKTWLGVEIPKASAVLSGFWTNTLSPALNTVGNFISGTIFPILEDLAKVWIAMAKTEVSALSALWTGVLWPALKVIGSYISDVLYPIFKALFEVAFAIASKAVEALAGLWQKVLWPALQEVGNYISTTVIPVFQSIGAYLSATFGPVLQSVTKWLGDITGGFEGVSGAVEYVVDKIEAFATAVGNLRLPSWLTPGSPTPWEVALYGIGKALTSSVSPGLASMKQGLTEVGGQITSTFANTDIIDALKDIGQDAMAGFGAGLKSGVKNIMSIVNSTAKKVEDAFKGALKTQSPSKVIEPIGMDTIAGLGVGIESGTQTVVDVAEESATNVVEAMSRGIESTTPQLADALKTVQYATESGSKDILTSLNNMLPGFMDLINQTGANMMMALKKNIQAGQDAIREQMEKMKAEVADIASSINEAIADGFGATASIDRQLASNVEKLKDVLPDYLQYTQGALNQAQKEAEKFIDPTKGAEYFKMRSNQILEYAKLQKDLSESTDADERARIQARMLLINKAQVAEISQSEAQQRGQTSALDDLQQRIAALFTGSDLANKLPGILENSVVAQLMSLLDQLRGSSSSYGSSASTTSSPASMSQQQGFAAGSGANNVNTSNRSYNLGVYTNNDSNSVQQSFALLEAIAS